MGTMSGFDEFEEAVHNALMHLYDPAYKPPAVLRQALGLAQERNADALNRLLVEAIEDLRPGPNTPPNARQARIYELLHSRYVNELTQKETALRLGITPRHLRREQQRAVQLLAEGLWEKQPSLTLLMPPESTDRPGAWPEGNRPMTWHNQVHSELQALQRSSPGAVVGAYEALARLREIFPALDAARRVQLVVDDGAGGVQIMMHPSVFHQVLITAVEKVAQPMEAGAVRVHVQVIGSMVQVRVIGYPYPAFDPPISEFIEQVMSAHGGASQISREGAHTGFLLTLPVVKRVNVLVVDDNADLVHFYQRYTEGTRYRITHLTEGRHLMPVVAEVQPDIIVLDVILPDIDGWELLSALHEDHATRHIPIIICSVVRQEELALSLGATNYLAKPIHRLEFIAALEAALQQGAEPRQREPKLN